MHSNGCISLLQAESQISAWSSLIVLHVTKRKKKEKGKSKGNKEFQRTAEIKGSWWAKHKGPVGSNDRSHPYQQLDTCKRWADAKWKEWVPWVWLPWSLCSKEGALVWICDHSNTNNPQVFWLLLSSTFFLYSISHSKQGKDEYKAREQSLTANPNWLYFMPCSTRKTEGRAFWGMQWVSLTADWQHISLLVGVVSVFTSFLHFPLLCSFT